MLLSRKIHKKNKQVFNPIHELKMNSFLNTVFYILMILELGVIRLGVTYPFGGRFIYAFQILYNPSYYLAAGKNERLSATRQDRL